MAERDYWNHPGGNNCVWNTPIGSGATWSGVNDLDSQAVRAGTAIINPPGNYGCCVWVSRSTSDPSATFIPYSSADFERGPSGRGIMAGTVTTMRAPRGSFTPGGSGATPVDGQFVVFDTVTPGIAGKVYHFAPLTITSFQGGVTYQYNSATGDMYFGGVEDALSDTFATDYETKNGNFVQAAGVVRGYDLDPNQNPSRMPAPNGHLTKIQHMLRYSIDGLYLKQNMVSYPTNSHLKPDSWPQYYHDWQGSISYNNYRGNLLYGSTIGIPANVPMPAGLSDPGKQLWFAFQNYGAITRDQAGGGLHVSCDQNVSQAWRDAAVNDMNTYMRSQWRIMRNQHQGGQSFTTNPMNGPGTRLDSGIPLLRGTSPVPPTPVTPSPSGTVVLSGSGGVITDAAGGQWTLPATQVVWNGVVDGTTSQVVKIAYVNGLIYQQNSAGNWWSKTNAQALWTPTTDPFVSTPPVFTESADNTIVLSGSTGSIIDSTGGKWELPGTQVIYNGTVDTSASGVARLAYVNKVVWQQNNVGLWWGRSAPYVGVPWSPAGGTITSPLPAPPPSESPDLTVVLAGSGSQIVDAAGHIYTLPASQVVIDGNTDTSTSSVTRLAYVNKVVWAQGSGGLWWGKSSYTAAWLPSGGTATSPLPGAPPTSTGALLLPAGYLSTQGNQTIDQNGNRVRIAAIGWNGGDGQGNAPQGLTQASLSGMMTNIVSLGFNCIRLPYNDRGFFTVGTTYITQNSFNPTLVGMTALQVMDAVVAAAKVVGLKIIIDHHVNGDGGGGQQPNGLWFDTGAGSDGTDGRGNTGTITRAMFQANWVALARRYKDNSTVIGFDLHNEPLGYSGMCTWGDAGTNDIRAMYQTVGNAILAENPGVLIICEGPQNYTSNYARTGIAPWGDLSNVEAYPVVLTDQSKVLYSIHCYPRAIASTMDSGTDFITNMNATWGYLVKRNLAAVWVGEMGASLNTTGGDTKATATQTQAQLIASEQAWAADFTAYLNGTAVNGPTFTASQQGIGTGWWVWGYLPGQPPEGVLQGGWSGTARSEQLAVYSQYRYTKAIAGGVLPRASVLTVGTPSTISAPLSWTSAAPVPTGTESADQTVVLDGSTEQITTARGDNWGVSGGRVTVNGTIDTGTGGVVRIAYVNGAVWQNNSAGMWWFKTVPGDIWGPGSGTLTSPLTMSYQPQFKLSTASTWADFGTPIVTRAVTVTGLSQGLTYNFRVVATNPSGSTTSNTVTSTTPTSGGGTPSTPPSAPGGLTSTNVTGTSLNLNWQPSTGTAPINYQPQYQKHPTSTPTYTPSPDKTTVLAGSGGTITDAAGNLWTITPGRQVAIGGVADTTSSNVAQIAYVGGSVWYQNLSQLWFQKTSPTASWAPAGGTSTSPLGGGTPTFTPSPDKTVVAAGSGGSITNAAGTVWTITAGGLVAVDTIADTTTSGVVQIAYVNGQVWQNNSAGYWWYKNVPSDIWLPGGGTLVNPVTGVAPSTASPDKTVVASGSAGVITDSAGHKWTLPGTQVVVDGNIDTTTSGVTQIAYVNGQVWQNNSAGSWWYKNVPGDLWLPAGGTLTNPITGVTPTTGTLITSPLVGTVTAGIWQELKYSGRTDYGLLAPANYDTTKTYPLILYMHQFSWGSFGFTYLKGQLDPWFNTVAWRRNYPCFVLAPLCYQGSNGGDSTLNWGGVEGANQTAQNDAIALVKQLKIQYPIAANKVYVTGNSMGGIGAWDDIIKFNRLTGTQDKLFSAALIMAGATYSNGAAGSSGGVPPSSTVTSNLKNVPIWAIHGQNDGNVPLAWDRAMNSAIGTAAGGQMTYTEVAGVGHDVWDDYYLRTSVWTWLFSRTV